MIDVRNVSKRYGRRQVLDAVSLTVRPGRITLLLGPNGSGKSTLLRCVLGIETFDGDVRVDGQDPLAEGRDVRGRIGYLPQHGGLPPDLTVRETLTFFAGLRGVSGDRVDSLLDEADLRGHELARAGELSGGLKQRLGFAVALLADPPILVLDEPGASLDAGSRRWLAGRLRRLADEGRTVLVSTHAYPELFDVADDRLTLEDGQLVTVEQCAGPDVECGPVTAAATTPAWRAMRTLLTKELRDAAHNRWLMSCAALIGVLGLAATASGIDGVSGLSVSTFGRTSATLLNLSLLLAPLVAVLMGAAAITGERERGTLDLLLAQPLTRTQLLLAKHGGLLTALTAATCAGFVPAAALVAIFAGPHALASFLIFPLLASMCAATMAGVGLLVSVTSRSAVQAQGTAVGLWFVFALLYDLLLVGLLSVSGMPVEWLAATLLANPVDAARVLGVLALEPDLYLLGPAGAYLSTRLSSAGAVLVLSAILLTWLVVPVGAAVASFSLSLKRYVHDTFWIRSRFGRWGTADRPRVHIERARV